nr:MAG TPA: hypothetical protein [Bacteriophage sp.]
MKSTINKLRNGWTVRLFYGANSARASADLKIRLQLY